MYRFAFLVLALVGSAVGQYNPWQLRPQPQRQLWQPQWQREPYWPQQEQTQFYTYDRPVAQIPDYQINTRFQQDQRRAIVKLDGPQVKGNVTFSQDVNGGPVRVQGTVVGLAPGRYGFHVHEKGDITGGCLSAGAHFNPTGNQHGAPEDANRHVGDLGNIVSNNNYQANIDISDNLLSLFGDNNIIGRAVVVHSGEDDLGRTNHPDSKTTGNAGSRVSCGVIGVLEGKSSATSSGTVSRVLILTALLSLVKLF